MGAILIKFGGAYNIVLIVFHLMFWRLFDWPRGLRSLTFLNRAVMQVLNISITLIFGLFAYVSLVHTEEMLSTGLGRALMVGLTAVWAARAVLQAIFFKLRTWSSWAFLVFFALGSLLYALPLVV